MLDRCVEMCQRKFSKKRKKEIKWTVFMCMLLKKDMHSNHNGVMAEMHEKYLNIVLWRHSLLTFKR